MKIALAGSTCSGKTTALAYLTYHLKGIRSQIGIGYEVAVDCPYPLNEEGGFATQWWVLSKQIEREHKMVDWFPNIIFDRSVYDSIAYALAMPKLSLKEKQFIQTTALLWAQLNPYDLIIYLTPLNNCPLDRKTHALQTNIDNSLKVVLKDYIGKGKVCMISAQDKERRCKLIKYAINEALKI